MAQENELRASLDRIPAADLLGFQVHPGTLEEYVALVGNSIATGTHTSILYHNLHTLHEYLRSPQLREWYQGSVVLIDGMPLIPLLKLGGIDVDRSHRITYVDFIWPLLQRAEEKGWRVFIIGQSEATLQAALEKIRQRLPSLQIKAHHGFFDSAAHSHDSQEIIKQMNEFGADLCLVGMGTPHQERWLHEHRQLIEAPAALVCGACMEYVAGTVSTPPRWMGRWGLEWSYRFFENPARFAHRYLIEPWSLMGLLLGNYIRSGSR